MHHYCISHSYSDLLGLSLQTCTRLTVSYVLDGSILADVDVQPLGLVVHCAHAVGLQDAVLLGKVRLCEGLDNVSTLFPRLA
jgi:hypothetical protein